MQKDLLENGKKLNQGRYETIRLLGRGGFGITYLAEDTQLDQKVVIKEYYPSVLAARGNDGRVDVLPESGEMYRKGMTRFLDEARILASLFEVPGVVKILDFFEENNTAYMVMEYVKGVSLRAYLERGGEMSFDEAFERLLPMIGSLEKIHEKGLIHRDINPDNIMVQEDGSFKLLDFGSAREFFLEEDREKTMSVIVKNGYAPIEQYESHGRQGPWVDVYALCATIYEMITGTVPQDASARIIKDSLYPPSAFGVSISPGQEELLIRRGLALQYADRFASMKELREAFAPREAAEAKSRKTVVVIAAAAVALLLLAGGIAAAVLSGGDEEQAAGNYARGSDEYNEFMEFVKERAVSTKEQKKNDAHEAGTIYELKEDDVIKWGAPSNCYCIDQTEDAFLSYLKKHGYDTKPVKEYSDCTVTEETYGVLKTEFSHYVVTDPGKGGPSKIGCGSDVVSGKLYRIMVLIDDVTDEKQYEFAAGYLCDFGPGDSGAVYDKEEITGDLMDRADYFMKHNDVGGYAVFGNVFCLGAAAEKLSGNRMCLFINPVDFDGYPVSHIW